MPRLTRLLFWAGLFGALLACDEGAEQSDAPDQSDAPGEDAVVVEDAAVDAGDAQAAEDARAVDASPEASPDAAVEVSDLRGAFLRCVQAVAAARTTCAATQDAACWEDPTVVAAAEPLAAFTVEQAVAGIPVEERFAPDASADALAARRVGWCRDVVEATAARTLGGPQAALLGSSEEGDACLRSALHTSLDGLSATFDALWACRDGRCSAEEVEAALAVAAASAVEALDERCDVRPQLGVGSPWLLAQAAEQAKCAFAALYPGYEGLELGCGPRAGIVAPERGQWEEVVFDSEVWGTRCADGSEYSFWFRSAPEGQPLDRIIIDMQGGGVCLFTDCADSYEERFQRWISSDTPRPSADRLARNGSPFSDWTLLRLPYCTQDIFAGNGTVEEFGGVEIQRYGAVNMRAAVRYVRDALWRELDRSRETGYRSDTMQVHLTGESAGGFGDAINYHFVVDELAWRNTSMAPTGALALGGGVLSLTALIVAKRQAWGLDFVLPSYCRRNDCVNGEVMIRAQSERMGTAPNQRALIASTQNDHVQVNTTLYGSQTDWVNAGRALYCDLRGLPWVNFFLTPSIEPRHDVRLTAVAGGVSYGDWLADAWDETPESLRDAVDEGGMAEAIDGVEPFPCELE